MKEPKDKSKKPDLMVQYYLIAYLDILGQRRELREIKDLPANGHASKDFQDFISKLKKTFGRVDGVRGLFQEYFDSCNSVEPSTELVSPELQEEFIACQKSEAYYYGFSDAVIIAVPLMGEDENCTAINGVYSALIATAGNGLLSLAAKGALRGGLDVGLAAQINDREIYGPALERAYFIESNIAEYPRFVVGSELLQYIKSIENQQAKTRLGLVAKHLAKLCGDMIVIDFDGYPMVHFLGERFRDSINGTIDYEIVIKARKFVADQYTRFRADENHKLMSRYFRLLRYIDAHIELWK